MVKGVTRQVVLVRSPDPEVFEQAIFIVRAGTKGASFSPEALLAQAQQAADAGPASRPSFRHRLLFALGGAGAVGLAWLLTVLV